MQVAVARQMYIAKNQADTDPALARLAQFTQRIIDVSRTPDGKSGSHVLAYADKDGATETNALFGTPMRLTVSSMPSEMLGRTMSCSSYPAASTNCNVSSATSCRTFQRCRQRRITAKAGGGEILVADTVRGISSGKVFPLCLTAASSSPKDSRSRCGVRGEVAGLTHHF
jgi:hypothetical protein